MGSSDSCFLSKPHTEPNHRKLLLRCISVSRSGYHKVIYYNYLTSGKLNAYLADIDEQAEEMFSRLIKDMADKQGIAENLKATDQMAWVGKMNNIRNAAMEIVNAELIYS